MMKSMLACLAAALLAGTASAATMPPPGPMPPAANRALAVSIFRDIVNIRSVHAVGTKQVAAVIEKYLVAGGFTPSEISVVPEKKAPWQVNLVVRLKGKGPKSQTNKPVMWICHMDVVDAKPEDWTMPPFKFTEKDGYFYGRGTSDMKDEDSAVAASLIRLKQEHYVPDRDIIVAFTADEEVGLDQDGPEYLLKNDPALVNAGVVMNPDGGSGEILDGKRLDFAVETAQKTYMTFKMETANKGGHSSEPRPDNAIYELAQGLVRLSHYRFPFKTNATTRGYFAELAKRASGEQQADLTALSKLPLDPAAAERASQDVAMNAILHTTCVATMLNAGVQENALPSRADATIQCRAFPDESIASVREALQQAVADPGIAVSLMEEVVKGPETVPDPAVMAKIGKVVESMWPGTPVLTEMAAGASDSLYTRNAGIPSYGVGGGWNDLGDLRMHGRDERHEVNDYYTTVEFTYRLMKEMTGKSQ